MQYIRELTYELEVACREMDREQWMVVFVAALVLGIFLLRGTGSRQGY